MVRALAYVKRVAACCAALGRRASALGFLGFRVLMLLRAFETFEGLTSELLIGFSGFLG